MEHEIRKALSDLPIGGVRYFVKTGSTNDDALAWAASSAPDLALVCADEQTQGRGRGAHGWFTPPGSALAFSLVLRPLPGEEQLVSLFSALGALAVCEALRAQNLQPEIKWPNDVLLNQRKVCGVLAESVWLGDKVDCIVLGIGVNVKPGAVPPPEQLNFPATCLETEAGQTIDRVVLLREILLAMLHWRGLLANVLFIHAWEDHLAFRGERVEIRSDLGDARVGMLDGLEPDGSLRLRSPQGQVFTIQVGEVHLRPVV